jgi:radical SAM superfamily enzyme YgiQ (UPF0313 family)
MNPGSAGRKRMRIVAPAFPAFNIYSRIARKTTALGPVCIATSVKELRGWDAEVIDENNYRRYGPRTPEGLPDHAALMRLRPVQVAGFYGGLTSTAPRLYDLARAYKKMGVVTVAGGQHFVAENLREALDNSIDYVVIGEGEETIQELLGALERNEDVSTVRGIAYLRGGNVCCTAPRPPVTDFERLALPDFSLVRYADIRIYPVSRIRGCGMDCEFCTVKGQPRCATPERLVEQISHILETRNAHQFFIVDDLFGQQRAETLRLCRLLRDYQRNAGRALDLTAQIRLDKAKDTELLTAMREAGINTVAIGFESPVAEELAAMNKHLNAEEMVALSRTFRRAGFLVHGMFIFGYPMQPGVTLTTPAAKRMKAYERFIRRARLDTVQVLLPVPLPGTELRERLQREGRLFPRTEFGWEYYDGNFPLFEPDAPMTAEEVQNAQRRMMGRFYRFIHMFLIGMDVLSFPLLLFFLRDLKLGWGLWYRSWRNDLHRFGGWLVLRRWTKAFKNNPFTEKLRRRQLAAHSSALRP